MPSVDSDAEHGLPGRSAKAGTVIVREIFVLAIEIGIHATLEHPKHSVVWTTPPINKLVGNGIHDVSVDRCRLDSRPSTDGR